MFKISVVLFVTCVGLQNTLAEKKQLAPYITPCKISDEKFNECFAENGNKAIKALIQGDKSRKIPSLMPFKIDHIILEPSDNFKLDLKNVEVTGFDTLVISNSDVNLEKREIKSTITVPHVEIIGEYEINGKILLLPINGHGPVNMTLVNVVFQYQVNYAVEEIDGFNQFVLKDQIVEYTPERVHYDLGNLFNGDKVLGDEMLKIINENWMQIDKELAGGLIETLKTLAANIITNSLKDVPYEDAFLP